MNLFKQERKSDQALVRVRPVNLLSHFTNMLVVKWIEETLPLNKIISF